jgi:hypothetical protein
VKPIALVILSLFWLITGLILLGPGYRTINEVNLLWREWFDGLYADGAVTGRLMLRDFLDATILGWALILHLKERLRLLTWKWICAGRRARQIRPEEHQIGETMQHQRDADHPSATPSPGRRPPADRNRQRRIAQGPDMVGLARPRQTLFCDAESLPEDLTSVR